MVANDCKNVGMIGIAVLKLQVFGFSHSQLKGVFDF